MRSITTLIALLICFKINAQTVIDYSGLSGSNCLFTSNTSVAATIGTSSGTITHRVTVGQVDNDAINGAVSFQSNNNSGSAGSEYRIEYGFTAGHTYKIVVSAFSIHSGNSSDPYLRIRAVGTTQTTSSCNGYQIIDGSLTGGTVDYKTITKSLSDFTFNFPSVNMSAMYLTIANIPTANVVQTIEIKKITITDETPPPSSPTFTLPTSTNVTCGSTSPKTFTITTQSNPGNLTITDYAWNLGAAPNGWLYNGSAAPSTPISTGTNNSITLTPVCGTTHSNISATVTAGGNTYNASGGAISVIAPSLSMVGDASICSGTATYSIANLPCDASVTWNLSPNSGIVSPNCTSCPSITLTKTGSGTVTLSATVTTSCSGVQSPSPKTITVGDPNLQFQVYPSTSQDCYLTNEYYDFYVTPTTEQQASIVNYVWGYRDLSTNVATVVNYDGVSGEAILFPYESQFEVFVQVESLCGNSTESVYNFLTASESCPGFAFNVSVAPNPSQNDAFVTITDQSKDVKALSANTDVIMDLYQVNSAQKLKQWKFKNDRNKYQINVRGLRKGMYTLVITIGKYKRAKQLLVTE